MIFIENVYTKNLYAIIENDSKCIDCNNDDVNSEINKINSGINLIDNKKKKVNSFIYMVQGFLVRRKENIT